MRQLRSGCGSVLLERAGGRDIVFIVSAAVVARQLLEHPLAGTAAADHADAITADVFSFCDGDLAVAPKDIDTLTKNAARIIARGITRALLPGVSAWEAAAFVP